MLDFCVGMGLISKNVGRKEPTLFDLAQRFEEKPRRSGEILVTRDFSDSPKSPSLIEDYVVVTGQGQVGEPVRVATSLRSDLIVTNKTEGLVVLTYDLIGLRNQGYTTSTYRGECTHVDLRPLCEHPVSIAFLTTFAAQAGHSRSIGLFLDRVAFLENRRSHNEAVAALATILL